ncbi:hypothetical protein M011DRAFT_326228 [Sporormia fimetaria CBS 119925]|uniref:Uncharacterized protein n=1 Tax=Sporormia fimetaria CBS 119925 TaxID=1340428 RepID=A0A6A6VHD6_9PLEO|nr:hypothetical protein M011DRAFT_326228 [Sporormia fimetaria CBS 119925]
MPGVHWSRRSSKEDPRETISFQGSERRLGDLEKACFELHASLSHRVSRLEGDVQKKCLQGTAFRAEHERASLKADVYNARRSFKSLETHYQEIRRLLNNREMC